MKKGNDLLSLGSICVKANLKYDTERCWSVHLEQLAVTKGASEISEIHLAISVIIDR